MQFLFLIMVPALNSIFSVAFLFTLSFTLSRIFSCKTQKFVRLSKFQKSPKNLDISTKNSRCKNVSEKLIITRNRVVAKQSRREGVYNRTGELDACLFTKKEEQRYERTLIFEKNQSKRYKACSDVVRRKGFEPPTFWFVAKHSIQLSYRRINLPR